MKIKIGARGTFVTVDGETYEANLRQEANRKLVGNIIKKILGMPL